MWLFDLAQIPIVERAVVASSDGLVIEAAGHRGPDPAFLAAEIAALKRSLENLESRLGGSTRRFVITMDERELLVVCEGEICVGAVIRRGPERRQVGQELTRLAELIAAELGG